MIITDVQMNHDAGYAVLRRAVVSRLLPDLRNLSRNLVNRLNLTFNNLMRIAFTMLIKRPRRSVIRIPTVLNTRNRQRRALNLRFLINDRRLIMNNKRLSTLLIGRHLIVRSMFKTKNSSQRNRRLTVLINNLHRNTLNRLKVPTKRMLINRLLRVINRATMLFRDKANLRARRVQTFTTNRQNLRLLLMINRFEDAPPISLSIQMLLLRNNMGQLPLNVNELPNPRNRLGQTILNASSLVKTTTTQATSNGRAYERGRDTRYNSHLLRIRRSYSPCFPYFSC